MKTAGTTRIAQRYVKALFDVAASDDAIAAVEKDMLALSHSLEESKDLQHFLTNPLMSRAEQAEAFDAILKKMKASKITQQFIAMVANQKRLGALPAIVKIFLERVASERGEIQGEIYAATALKPAEVEKISERLSKIYNKNVQLTLHVDPALLGGVVVQIGSQQLDASLAGKITRLKNTLQAA